MGDGNTVVEFQYYENFGDTLEEPLSVLVTGSYTGDPTTTFWTSITPAGLNGSTSDAWIPVRSQPMGLTGDAVRVAFLYRSAGDGGGTTKRIGVDNVCILPGPAELGAEFAISQTGGTVTFSASISGGNSPYSIVWDFGDGSTSTELDATHTYAAAGAYLVTLRVTDATGTVVETMTDETDAIVVTDFDDPEPVGALRVATFNTSMNRPNAGDLAAALAAGDDSQIAQVAEVIQRNKPDVVLLNEFDHIYDVDGNSAFRQRAIGTFPLTSAARKCTCYAATPLRRFSTMEPRRPIRTPESPIGMVCGIMMRSGSGPTTSTPRKATKSTTTSSGTRKEGGRKLPRAVSKRKIDSLSSATRTPILRIDVSVENAKNYQRTRR